MSENNILSEIKDILDVMELREKLDSQSLLKSITNQLVSAKLKDKSTLIYRMAMTIYHSSKYWKNNIIEEIDDPVNIYLKLSGSKTFQEKYADFWAKINTASPLKQTNLIRTFTCFISAAYYYLTAIKGEDNGT